MGFMTQGKLDAIEAAAKELEVELDYGTEIKKGDMYLAVRNGPVKLLTCVYVTNNYIINEENDYPYDVWECVRIKQ